MARLIRGAKKMHREIALGLVLIGLGIVAAYVASPWVTGPEEHVALSPQASVAAPIRRATEPRDQPPVVVRVLQRPGAQNGDVRAEDTQPLALPGDRSQLARALQRELQRVGCYDREINGIWTTSSRMAMQMFLQRVNSALPFDTPDVILLSLVQAHEGVACRNSCPTDQSLPGQCPPHPLVTTKFKPHDGAAERSNPLVTGSLPAISSSQPAPQSTPAPGRVAAKVGITGSAPPKFVRKVLKSLQRGMAQLGLR
jgi:hypothetical protein